MQVDKETSRDLQSPSCHLWKHGIDRKSYWKSMSTRESAGTEKRRRTLDRWTYRKVDENVNESAFHCVYIPLGLELRQRGYERIVTVHYVIVVENTLDHLFPTLKLVFFEKQL